MKCTNCGAEINGTESFCGKCGAKIEGTQQGNNQYISSEQSNKTNQKAIISLVLSIISYIIFAWLSVAGIVAGVYALREIKETNEKGKVLAYIGIILGGLSVLLFLAGQVLRVTSAI